MTTVKKINPQLFKGAIRQLGECHQDFSDESAFGALDIDYNMLDACGDMFQFFGLFDDDALVGYGGIFVSRHHHYNVIVARHDTLFVLKKYTRHIFKLVDAMQDAAKESGAEFMFWSAKSGTAFDKWLSKRYNQEEIVYLQEL